MAPAHIAFVHASSTPVSLRSSWTGTRLTARHAPEHWRPRIAPTLTLSPSGRTFRRALALRKQAAPAVVAPAAAAPLAPLPAAKRASLPATLLSAALIRPARSALVLAARAAKRIATVRKQHGSKLRFARMGATLALAMASYFVTRGTMSGVANIAAPALPTFPFKVALPQRLSAVIKPFTESFGVVFLSEFGDKSMFATALMAMKHNPFIVCIGALAALTVMTFIACFLGQLMHLLPATVTHYSSIALFVFFGLQMIMQARSLPDRPGGVGGERADAEEMVAEAAMAHVQSPLSILAKVSSLIFVAEWCDRSMLATMALAASSNTVAVIGGATFANILCTGMAVCAATLVASRISERMVALIAGILFEFFAVFTYFEGPEGG